MDYGISMLTTKSLTSRSRGPGLPPAALTTFLTILIASGTALGQTPGGARPDTGKATSLGTVVVSATRSTTTAERVPLHVTVVPALAIQHSPARTLDQLLRDIPGVNMPGAPYYTTDPTGQQTKLRGVTNSKVLVLVDGVPIHDPFYATTQWFKVPLSEIDRIEVLRGGSSSVWGNLAVAGVINVITKKPIDDATRADVSYQSQNTMNAAVAKSFAFSNGLSFRMSGDRLATDGYQTTPSAYLNTVPGKSASSATNENAQVSAYYTPAASWNAFARAGYHRQDEDVGGYTFGHNIQKSPDAAAGVTKYFADRARADVRAWSQYESFDKSNGAGCYLASATNCNTTALGSPLVQYANSHDDNPYREFGASAVLSSVDLAAGPLSSVQVGADFRSVSGEDFATTYNRPSTTDAASASINRTNFGKGLQQFAGVFTQLTASLVARLEATLSLRYDSWSNRDGVAELTKFSNGAAGATLGGPVSDSHASSLNPTLSARFAATDALSLRGAAYRAFRAPGLNNLYRSFSSTTSITIANPLLKPETLNGGEVGADWRTKDLTLGATWFRYETQSLIASYKITSAATAPAAVIAVCGATLANCPSNVNFNTNSQDAVSRGLELVGNWRPMRLVGLDAGYTYTDSHYTATTTGDPVGAQLGAIPKNAATLGVNLQPTNRWSVYANARYNGAMYLDVNQTIRQNAFTVVNASTTFQATSRVDVYGSVVNLTDVVYADNATTSASGQILGMPRAFSTGVRLRF